MVHAVDCCPADLCPTPVLNRLQKQGLEYFSVPFESGQFQLVTSPFFFPNTWSRGPNDTNPVALVEKETRAVTGSTFDLCDVLPGVILLLPEAWSHVGPKLEETWLGIRGFCRDFRDVVKNFYIVRISRVEVELSELSRNLK